MSQISIILPTYNVEKYIAKAIESCINQTFKDIEIIVVDDCGSDKSINIAKEYAKKDARIKIIHNEKNLGLLRARYEGVKAANSLYIMFLDPDDYLEFEACEIALENIRKDVDLLWFDFIYIDENNFITKDSKLKDRIYNMDAYCTYVTSINHIKWNLCSKVIKKEIYLKSISLLETKYKLTMSEDALLYFFMLLNCKNIATSSKHIYYYHKNIDSSTETQNMKKLARYIREELLVIDIIKSFLDNNKIANTKLNVFYKIIICNLTINLANKKIKFNMLKHKKES
ncbi:glycosyltransferase family 2 protein, partial [Campylobacter jejuni]|nr:glycosyltransferase family 2 protein [Campylobacter jejuni]EHD3811715.1 glycosyltransferase family 2 protein [Campylobacter jejuni]HEH5259982.1 glycosyltransferase family 2 protein [Campylobacter jejuni]